jgi:hypothetical protein
MYFSLFFHLSQFVCEMLYVSECLFVPWDIFTKNVEFYCACLVTMDINVLKAMNIIILCCIKRIETCCGCYRTVLSIAFKVKNN